MSGKLKKRLISMSYVVAFTLIMGMMCNEKVMANENTEEVGIRLSDYEYEVSFVSREDIEAIADEYNLGNAEDIEEIVYLPIVDNSTEESVEDGISTAEVGAPEYYVKKKGKEEKKGELLRSSWYQAPSGTMTISEEVSTTVSFANSSSIEGGTSELKAVLKTEYGFSVTKKVNVSDKQNVTIPKGYKKNVKAYVNNMVYTFELWEDDVIKDDYIGKGTIKKPIGVIFEIGKAQKI